MIRYFIFIWPVSIRSVVACRTRVSPVLANSNRFCKLYNSWDVVSVDRPRTALAIDSKACQLQSDSPSYRTRPPQCQHPHRKPWRTADLIRRSKCWKVWHHDGLVLPSAGAWTRRALRWWNLALRPRWSTGSCLCGAAETISDSWCLSPCEYSPSCFWIDFFLAGSNSPCTRRY